MKMTHTIQITCSKPKFSMGFQIKKIRSYANDNHANVLIPEKIFLLIRLPF